MAFAEPAKDGVKATATKNDRKTAIPPQRGTFPSCLFRASGMSTRYHSRASPRNPKQNNTDKVKARSVMQKRLIMSPPRRG
ncbi:hypothetical protein CEV33_3062 [Brucella grignonensis]|uniref:Uncharacterized protein n=1 Tax=Brucella grignonensis TaxID=94627 RepID=A0A256F1C1_9HYPH|nr:hypothetical protein CEV33_3062 [Brucella grignonensis]